MIGKHLSAKLNLPNEKTFFFNFQIWPLDMNKNTHNNESKIL